ncbi:head GIN domain-containing protein [Alteraurantiacibacter buctensis]|uniref:DUF2807 domain-containing protein n=1 Tax=Alteraurantiacibacter buctensis TaxID=1503981 RepID=A0A844YU47_9SPHN|nr:head GIN domain-containing protein [Alteraurantiacibacter buctensis]MXO70536.1 DUF2807 domain-containing protein [Alteraurantiacibacter buctensis]
MTGRHGAGGFDRMFRAIGPFVAMAAMGGAMAAARKSGKFEFDWDDEKGGAKGFGPAGFGTAGGVPFAEFDMDGDVPTGLVLAGADTLVVREGEEFAVAVQGDDEAKDTLRFRLKDDVLQIASRNTGNGGEGVATITVTMPAPAKVTIAGAGRIELEKLAEFAEVIIAGAGRIEVQEVALTELDVSIAGSGRFKASGRVAQLNLNVAGSGRAKLGAVMVEEACVTIAGSGRAVFASDGEVSARLMGSGTVTVRGSARCEVKGMGTGRLVCERREDSGDDVVD